MAHHIYTTDAFVIDTVPSREADRLYTLFTHDLGMLRASAQGVRLLKSKLRFSLQEFSLIKLSVVRGREFWRITNAAAAASLYSEHKSNPPVLYVFARILKLLRRLVPEEEKNQELFAELINAYRFVSDRALEAEQALGFEYILALRILYHLGYLADIQEFRPFIRSAWSADLLGQIMPKKKAAVAVINAALHESHL